MKETNNPLIVTWVKSWHAHNANVLLKHFVLLR